MHLLKKLKITLKESTVETDGLRAEISEILHDIRIASIRNQVCSFEYFGIRLFVCYYSVKVYC